MVPCTHARRYTRTHGWRERGTDGRTNGRIDTDRQRERDGQTETERVRETERELNVDDRFVIDIFFTTDLE